MGRRWVAALGITAVLAAGESGAQPQDGAPRIEVRARALVPGEPVRVIVEPATPLGALEGSFLDRPLDFVHAAGLGGSDRWLAWGVIPLDARSGRAVVAVRGTSAGGAAVVASRTLEIRAKRFPTQQLDVESKFVTPPPEVAERIAAERKRLAAIYAHATTRAPAAQPFIAPVKGQPTSTFGGRRIFNGVPRDPHPGLDLRAATGTPVAASGAGRVVLATDLYFSGGTVIVDHGGGLFTVYAHLSRIDAQVDDEIEAGATVGLSGATGRVTGPHLHWGAKIGEVPFDPRALMDSGLFR